MKVGVLGSGAVARALGTGFLAHGHNVMLGTRDAARLAGWGEQNPEGRVGSFAEAAEHGGLVVLAVKGSAAADVLRLAGPAKLDGKPVIDTTNPIADAPPANGVMQFFTNLDQSLMERLQGEFPELRLVKAFNSVGSAHMVDPSFEGGRPTMFICGNNDDAKRIVGGILEQFGWEPEDMGGAEAARAIEPLCILWCIPGFLRNQWDHAFKVLR
jgi:predicted dinucleotide-binding enzyme